MWSGCGTRCDVAAGAGQVSLGEDTKKAGIYERTLHGLAGLGISTAQGLLRLFSLLFS